MQFYNLQKIYDHKELFYWCNCTLDINMPSDPFDEFIVHSSDELPPKAMLLYDNFMSEGNKCLEYVVSFKGRVAYAFGMLFDEEWVDEELHIPLEQLTPLIGKMAANVFNGPLFEHCSFLIGNGTDPLGSELLIVLPYENRECIPQIEKNFAADRYDPWSWLENHIAATIFD